MVASYLLPERKFSDQVDEQGGDYIGYSVDGSKRMKALIDDLPPCSRVSSRARPFASVVMNDFAMKALGNVAEAVREADAETVIDPLPAVNTDNGRWSGSRILRVTP